MLFHKNNNKAKQDGFTGGGNSKNITKHNKQATKKAKQLQELEPSDHTKKNTSKTKS